MQVQTDKIQTDGCIKCDLCRTKPAAEQDMWQVSFAARVRTYCVNCWLRYRAMILAGRA